MTAPLQLARHPRADRTHAGDGTLLERPVPYDLQAEEAVIGALILDRDAIIKVAAFLRPEDFYRSAWGDVYSAILDLYRQRVPPDLVTLSTALANRGRLESVGGLAALAGAMGRVPTSVHVEYYGRIVERAAFLRRVISVGGQIAGMGYDEDTAGSEDGLRDLTKQIFRKLQLALRRESIGGLRPVGELLSTRFELFDATETGGITGITTFSPALTELLGGFQLGELVVVAGTPASGKTAFGVASMVEAAFAPRPPHPGDSAGTLRPPAHVAYYSIEMAVNKILDRTLSYLTRRADLAAGVPSADAGVPLTQIIRNRLTEGEWGKITEAAAVLAGLNIYLDPHVSQDVNEIMLRVRQRYAESGVDCLIIDYVQLMRSDDPRTRANKAVELANVVRELEQLAKDLNCAIILLAQIKRDAGDYDDDDEIPPALALSTLSDSSELEKAARVALFLRRNARNPTYWGRGEIDILKNSNGAPGYFMVDYDVTRLYFSESADQSRPLASPRKRAHY